MHVLYAHSKDVQLYPFLHAQAHSGMFVIIVNDNPSRIVSHKFHFMRPKTQSIIYINGRPKAYICGLRLQW